MIGIIVASEKEAAPFLESLAWRHMVAQPFRTYKGLLGPAEIPAFLMVSGVGKVPAAVAAHQLIRIDGATRIFNFGICGALQESRPFEIGAVFRIESAIEGDRAQGPFALLPERCASAPFEALPGARLVTCDQPVFESKRKKALSRLGDLADMEGAAIARVANLYATPCVLIKGITDSAAEGDRRALIQNIDAVSRKLASLFIDHIEQFTLS